MSRRFAPICAFLLPLLSVIVSREARAQNDTMLVTVLRPTALRSAPSASARTIVIVNPTTFAATKVRVANGFLRVLVEQIDRSRRGNQLGFIAVADVDVDSGSAEAPVPRAEPAVTRAEPAPLPTAVPVRPRADTAAPPRTETAPTPPTETATRSTASSAGELVIRPNAPPPPPNATDTRELNFLEKGSLAAIVQRPMSYRIGAGRDSIVVPAGFVADFASIPRSLWTELSPVGAHTLAVVVHDYLYWFQPCEREEADNLLMIAMQQENVSDLERGAVYAGVRIAGGEAWNANAAARDRGELRIAPTQVAPNATESWTEYRERLGRADIRGTPGRMARQPYCDLGKAQQAP